MTMRFEIKPLAGLLPSAELIYRDEEYSFDMNPSLQRRFTSVSVDDLNLEIDESGEVVGVWGMCPYTRWKDTKLDPPDAQPDKLFFISDRPLQRGVSIQLNSDKYWLTCVDFNSRWVHIKGRTNPVAAVKVFHDVIVELDGAGQLCSLWLRLNRNTENKE